MFPITAASLGPYLEPGQAWPRTKRDSFSSSRGCVSGDCDRCCLAKQRP